MTDESGAEDLSATILAFVAIVPILAGAFAIVHFELTLSSRTLVSLILATVMWLLFWSVLIDRPKGDTKWMMAILLPAAVLAFVLLVFTAVNGGVSGLYWDWAVVFVACLLSLQHAAFRHKWRLPS